MAGSVEKGSAIGAANVFPRAYSTLQEVPVAICVNGVSHAVMLASPCDLEDFARGFAFSEGLVGDFAELLDVEAGRNGDGWVVNLTLSGRAERRLRVRRRTIAGRTGCGLCGVEALADAIPELEPLPAQSPPAAAVIERARVLLPELQIHNRRCGGGLHAAALFDGDATPLLAREDIGRHNALDKLIGARRGAVAADNFAVLTSRCSFELVMKAARARIGTLVTLAAPTELAVTLAANANLNLLCYGGPTLYCYHSAQAAGTGDSADHIDSGSLAPKVP